MRAIQTAMSSGADFDKRKERAYVVPKSILAKIDLAPLPGDDKLFLTIKSSGSAGLLRSCGLTMPTFVRGSAPIPSN